MAISLRPKLYPGDHRNPHSPSVLASARTWLVLPALLLALLALCVPADRRPVPASPTETDTGHVAASYARLPLSFEPNQGQADSAARFLARGGGYALLLSPAEAIFRLRGSGGDAGAPQPAGDDPTAPPTAEARVHLQLVDTNPAAEIVGIERLPGVVNYFLGNVPSAWRTDIPTFARVKVANAWPGVDVVYYGNAGRLEADLVVAPGVDPQVIKLKVADAPPPSLDDAGDLRLSAADDGWRLSRPVVYQEAAGTRQPVSGEYVLGADGLVSFRVGAYDATRPLVIDPVLVYLARYGSSLGDDQGYAIAADKDGNVYLAGFSQKGPDSDFPLVNPVQPNVPDAENAFVAKLNPAGTALIYSSWIGGNNWEEAHGIAVDGAGNAYVTGMTRSADFPTTPGAVDPSLDFDPDECYRDVWWCPDAFVFKLSPTGSTLVYSTFLGGNTFDWGWAIAVDATGNAYVTGNTAGHVFVTKLNPAGSAQVYSMALAGNGQETGYGIAVDAAGNAYVTGATSSSNFPTTAGSFQPAQPGGGATFVTKIAAAGAAVVFSTYLGGTNGAEGRAIAVDGEGGVYVGGATGSTDFPVKNAFQPCHGGDGFVTKFEPSGKTLAYSTCLGGNQDDRVNAIAVDFAGLAYVAGTTDSTDFPLERAVQTEKKGRYSEAFVAQLAGDGSALLFSTYLGGTNSNDVRGADQGYGIAVDANQNAYAVGQTNAFDFLPTAGSLRPPGDFYSNYYDAWIAKLELTTGGVPVKGRAYARAEADGVVYPLIGVPVVAVREGKVLRQAITRDDGAFTLPGVPITDNLKLRATLRHDAVSPPSFQVTYGRREKAGGPVVSAETYTFTVTGAEPEVQQDIVFAETADITPVVGVPKAHLDDLGVIYFHTRQAWQLTDRFKQPLDFALPVDMVAFSLADGVSWRGNNSDDSTFEPDPFVNIEARSGSSLYNDRNRTDNREWHEFGHHVMADSFGNLMPRYPRGADNQNHWGYANVTTTDSWVEGFAEFYSLLVAQRIADEDRPELYHWVTEGGSTNLESNYNAMTWTDEEFAVAGLLWDLTDPADADDASVMTDTLGIATTYRDCVQEDPVQLWSWLTANYTGTVPLSPVASRQGYGYLFDVKQLYDVLKLKGVGQTASQASGLNDLDALFVAHGFFADVAPMNRGRDAGEQVGLTGYLGGWRSAPRPSDGANVLMPARPERRDVEPVPGSYVAYQAVDATTGAPVDVRDFAVEVRFAPPFEHYSYRFTQHAQNPGRLYFYAADPQYAVTTVILPQAAGYAAPAPFTVTNAFYWQQMATWPADHFTEHTFTLQRNLLAIHLPLILKGAGRGSVTASGASAAQGSTSRLVAHTPRPCVPDAPTPTPTATATSSATPTPTVTATPSVTATATPSATPTASVTASPTGTRTPSPTATGTPTATQTPTATATGGPSHTPTPTRTATATPTPTASASVTATPTLTATPTNTQSPIPNTSTPTPTATPRIAGCEWFDDFSAPLLDAAWAWVREDPTHWSLAARPGYLRIVTQAGDLWTTANNARNLLLRSAPAGDFEISTRVEIKPTQNYQQADLIVWADDDNYVKLGRSYANSGLVEFDAEIGGVFQSQVAALSLDAVYLKIVRAGTTFAGYLSADGLNWLPAGQYTGGNWPTLRIGLGAWNGGTPVPDIPADFDWFCLGGATGPTPTPTPTATPTQTWQVIYSDSFEGSFPGPWQRIGNPGWGRTSCKAASGSYSVWPAADGTGAVTPCVNNYPDNLNAWLIYGPFDLRGATAAELTFRRWQRSEAGYDSLNWLASTDGQHFYGVMDSGDTGGWVAETLDLSNVYTLGDLRGQPQVWVAFLFQSDADTNDVGAFVDEVVVRKR